MSDYPTEIANTIIQTMQLDPKSLHKIINLIKPANKNIKADFAINCFALQPEFNSKNGIEIAAKITAAFQNSENKIDLSASIIKNVESAGPYLNIYINKGKMAFGVVENIFKNVNNYATSIYSDKNKTPKKLVIEYPSPNTNKPLHLGHVRNMLLGQVLSKIQKFVRNDVSEINLLNDRGVHIMKSIWAYEKFGEGKTPESEHIKSDHYVGKFYVKYATEEKKLENQIESILKEFETEKRKPHDEQDTTKIQTLQNQIAESKYGQLQATIKQMLVDWENKDENIRTLWRKMNDWAESGYQKTFELFKITHDKTYYESQIYNKGKEIVLKGLEDGIFTKLDDGAVAMLFNKKGLPKQKILLRRDGTTLYATQDIHLAFQKMKDFNYDTSIYIIGNEQNMQLKIIFEILKKLGMKAHNVHYSYGMINLTTGKMKSREGTVVDADDLVEELTQLSLNGIKERYPDIDETELLRRAKIIGMAALRFFIIKYDYKRDFLFDPEKSIEFEGETGPYILYSYARICSIFRKGIENGIVVPYYPTTDIINEDYKIDGNTFNKLDHEKEQELIDHLYQYPTIINEAAAQNKPHVITRYIYELAQYFTSFYHACPILKETGDKLKLRLILAESVRRVMKNALSILSIDTLNEM